jgi:hypothetical protein
MRNVLFKRRKGARGIEKIIAHQFEQSHSERDLHQFLESEPSLVARGVSEGETVPTVVAASHLALPSGEMDLLLLDADGQVTLAELKRGRTPREVAAQVLDYAAQVTKMGFDGLKKAGVDWDGAIGRLCEANETVEDLDADRIAVGLQSPRLLIVAFEIDDTTKAIAEYLRPRGVPIYCIEFEYFTDEQFEYYYPELIGAEEVGRIASKQETPTQVALRAIWDELLARFKSARPSATRRTGTKDPWMQVPIGMARAHLEWHIHKLTRQDCWCEVGLHLEHPEREKNLAALRWLEEKRPQLEAALGEKFLLEEWGERWARVYARRDTLGMDQAARDWALNTMLRFYDSVERLDVVANLRRFGL